MQPWKKHQQISMSRTKLFMRCQGVSTCDSNIVLLNIVNWFILTIYVLCCFETFESGFFFRRNVPEPACRARNRWVNLDMSAPCRNCSNHRCAEPTMSLTWISNVEADRPRKYQQSLCPRRLCNLFELNDSIITRATL